MANHKMGRRSIFRGKADGYRVQAIITKVGGQRFERARRGLAALYERVYGVAPATISDADLVEALARGEEETEAYLAGRK